MKWLSVAVILIAGLFTSFQAAQAQEDVWQVEFYTNPFLQGTPAATTIVKDVNYDWSTGAPFTGFQTDDFSIRFTRNVWFSESGVYRFTVNADDHFQLGIDQKVVLSTIEEGAPGDPKSVDVNITAGVHTVQISYQEFIGFAFLFFDWKKVGASSTTTVNPSPAGQFATVNVFRLNVRSEPTISGTIITKISSGETFPVVGRNENGSWIQINVNGQIGWVSAPLVRVSGNAPQTSATPSAPGAPRTLVNLNFRTGPGTEFESMQVIPRGSTVEVTGRNADTSWLRVNFNGRTGWVIARFVRSETKFDDLPVVQ
jgi:uncharacterized protein YraI